jgi:hypothetical protein
MKRIVLVIAIAAVAHTALAGLSYRFESVTTGLRESTISGTTQAEGNSFRMNIAHGDGFTFADNSFVVSHDGGKTIFVVDPSSKSYYQIDLADASGSAAALFKQLGYLNFKITDPKVTSRDLGKGETIAGYPTQRSQVNSSYAMSVGSGPQAMKISITMSTESWTTDRIPAELTNFLQKQSITTGVEQIDKVIASATAAAKGFPLKQVTTFRITQNGRPIESKSTTQIRDIAQKTFPASEFALPAGYKKTDNPIERMMKAFQ